MADNEQLAIELAGQIKEILADLKSKGGFTPNNLSVVNEAIDKIDAILNDDKVKNNPALNATVTAFAKNYRKLRDDYFKAHEGIV